MGAWRPHQQQLIVLTDRMLLPGPQGRRAVWSVQLMGQAHRLLVLLEEPRTRAGQPSACSGPLFSHGDSIPHQKNPHTCMCRHPRSRQSCTHPTPHSCFLVGTGLGQRPAGPGNEQGSMPASSMASSRRGSKLLVAASFVSGTLHPAERGWDTGGWDPKVELQTGTKSMAFSVLFLFNKTHTLTIKSVFKP